MTLLGPETDSIIDRAIAIADPLDLVDRLADGMQRKGSVEGVSLELPDVPGPMDFEMGP